MDDEDGYSSDEVDVDVEEQALKDLRAGKLIVKNAEGTLRCPYSPSRKKQAYAYKDLLQHADGVAKGKRGPEAAGKHSALSKFLRKDLANLALPPVERVHKLELKAPQRIRQGDLLVFPWCAVIYNIDNSKVSKGLSVGPGVSDIREHFAAFNPDRVHVLWGPRGHMGFAVLSFKNDLEGLKDAQALEKWFIEQEYGRKDWERRRRDGHGLGSSLYGWLARKEDFDGRREWKDDQFVAKYLQENGQLKDVQMVGDEMKKVADQQFQGLRDTEAKIRGDYHALYEMAEIARRNADIVKDELERKHKEELEEVRNKERQSTMDHSKAMDEHSRKLQVSMENLAKKCKDLERKEQENLKEQDNLKSQANKLLKEKLDKEMIKMNQRKISQRKYHAEQIKLIGKHEEENKRLEEYIQMRKLKLAEQQQKELRVMQLEEVIDTEKYNKSVDPELEESSSASDLVEKKLQDLEDQKAQYEEQLQELKEENENHNTTINVLIQKQLTANDELEDARKLSIKALFKHGTETLCIKRMGEIDEKPWKPACQRFYKSHRDGWEVKFGTLFSEWEEVVKDHNFTPFKNVHVGEDKWEQQYDKDNTKLETLKSELGKEVWETVMTAYKEIEEYNASGRYPVPAIWNAQEHRRATLSEVINRLLEVIDTLAPPKKKKGVKRPARD